MQRRINPRGITFIGHFGRFNDSISGFCPILSFPDGEGIHPPRPAADTPQWGEFLKCSSDKSQRDGMIIEKCVNKKIKSQRMTYSIIMPLLRSLNEIISRRDYRFIELWYLFFCPIPTFPDGEGIIKFSTTGRKQEGRGFGYIIHPIRLCPRQLKSEIFKFSLFVIIFSSMPKIVCFIP